MCNRDEEYKEANDDVPELVQLKKRLKLSCCEEQELLNWKIKNLLVIKEGCDDAPEFQRWINDQLKKLVHAHIMPAGQETATEHNNNNTRQNNTTEQNSTVATGLLLKCQYDTDIED